MSKVETLIQEIKQLPQGDLELIMRAIQQKLERVNRVKAALSKVRGAGQGVWNMDAQEYINQSREER